MQNTLQHIAIGSIVSVISAYVVFMPNMFISQYTRYIQLGSMFYNNSSIRKMVYIKLTNALAISAIFGGFLGGIMSMV